jgi:glycosyltransferase involved in cell wall biosynthesis
LRVIFFQNIIAPYKTLLFNTLGRRMGKDFLVVYLAETAGNREWRIPKDEIEYPYEVLSEGTEEGASPWRTVSKAWGLLERNNPETVVVGGYDYAAFWAALYWAKRRRKKSLIILESHFLDRPRNRFREHVKRFLVSRCDAALVDGTRHRDYAVSLGVPPDRVFIKGGAGPVDVDLYRREMDRLRPGKADHCRALGVPRRNFLYVGRFSSEKNLMVLLRAYSRLRKGGCSDWGLILVGDGPDRREMERFIRDQDLPGVHLPGFKQREEVPFYYAISDVFVLPSVSEPWGLVVVEAMACGLPVLVSDRCGCFPDAVREGENGFSFNPAREEDLYVRMKCFTLDTYDLQGLGARSSEIAADFAPGKAADEYRRAIDFASGRGSCTSH